MIGTLIAGGVYYANIGQKVSAVDLVSLKTALVIRFPEAIATIYSERQSLEDVTAAKLVTTGSVQENRPVDWAVSTETPPEARTLELVFTLKTNDQAESLETYLDDNLDTTLVKEVEVTDAQVTVVYEVS